MPGHQVGATEPPRCLGTGSDDDLGIERNLLQYIAILEKRHTSPLSKTSRACQAPTCTEPSCRESPARIPQRLLLGRSVRPSCRTRSGLQRSSIPFAVDSFLRGVSARCNRHHTLRCALRPASSTDAIRAHLRFIGMPQRSLASLVLGPILIGVLCLALACVAGARTDRLGDTLTVTDTLHAQAPDTGQRHADSTRAADADSAAA